MPVKKLSLVKPKKFNSGLKVHTLVDPVLKHLAKDRWSSVNGEPRRFREIYLYDLGRKPLTHLLELKKRGINRPQVMIVGPGVGEDIIELKQYLKKENIFPEFDVFGLKRTLSDDVQDIVRKDYSRNLPIETLGSRFDNYPELINRIKGKYDLLVAPLSAGVYTNYPAHNCFFMAMMLLENGEAYIEINDQVQKSKLKQQNTTRLSKIDVINYIRVLFPRLVDIYNKLNSSNYQFEMNFLPNGYIQIKRVA